MHFINVIYFGCSLESCSASNAKLRSDKAWVEPLLWHILLHTEMTVPHHLLTATASQSNQGEDMQEQCTRIKNNSCFLEFAASTTSSLHASVKFSCIPFNLAWKWMAVLSAVQCSSVCQENAFETGSQSWSALTETGCSSTKLPDDDTMGDGRGAGVGQFTGFYPSISVQISCRNNPKNGRIDFNQLSLLYLHLVLHTGYRIWTEGRCCHHLLNRFIDH